ncbi:MAG TPA: hypothetical protein VD948_08560 [Rhodothermales bacterium]|nr:hypothetical protein [Rhodothermales bacterium]
MSDALKITGTAGRPAPKPYITGSSLPMTHQGVTDAQACVDAADARRSAGEDQQYGGPEHVQKIAKQKEADRMDAFRKKYGL